MPFYLVLRHGHLHPLSKKLAVQHVGQLLDKIYAEFRFYCPRFTTVVRITPFVLFFQVNLAHQGMGDVMGSILADCLAGLPLMRELNLRDNRLTDKGLIPIVKVKILWYCCPAFLVIYYWRMRHLSLHRAK